MTRLSIFAKGNLDVRDVLHSQWVDGKCRWNGLNALLRARGSRTSIHVRHEVMTRSDALLQADGQVPGLFAGRSLPLGAHSLEAQFSRALFAPWGAYVLSIQADVQIALARHRGDDVLFYPGEPARWSASDRDWLRADFRPTGLLDPAGAMDNFARIIARIREISTAPILIFNVSSTVPGETLHDFTGAEEILSTRIRRFNLALVELSQRTGISIVDVDRTLAELGTARAKLDATHFTPLGCRAVADEVVRILEDYGCLEPEAAAR